MQKFWNWFLNNSQFPSWVVSNEEEIGASGEARWERSRISGRRLGDCEDGKTLWEGKSPASSSSNVSSSTILTECRNGSPKSFVAFLLPDEVLIVSESSTTGWAGRERDGHDEYDSVGALCAGWTGPSWTTSSRERCCEWTIVTAGSTDWVMGGRETRVSIGDWPGVKDESPNVTGSKLSCNRGRFSIGVDSRTTCKVFWPEEPSLDKSDKRRVSNLLVLDSRRGCRVGKRRTLSWAPGGAVTERTSAKQSVLRERPVFSEWAKSEWRLDSSWRTRFPP